MVVKERLRGKYAEAVVEVEVLKTSTREQVLLLRR
jgi:hypothetical protein